MDRRTPPPISWTDLAGRRVGVWGLGREGEANLRKLRAIGVEPVLVDDNPAAARSEILATGEGGLDALKACDVVIKTPGISRYRPEVDALWEAGTVVAGGLGLWLAEAPRQRVVCVTGSKGKSTTTSILGHLLKGLGRSVFVGGNLGFPPYDPELRLPDADEPEFWVIETSSYQATDLGVSPVVTAVTSLSPDHLSWHRDDPDTYYADKLSMCHQPGAKVTVANGRDARLRDREAMLAPAVTWVDHDPSAPAPAWVEALELLGQHNHLNAMIARACVAELGIDCTDDELLRAAEGMEPLPSRMQLIGTVDGVRFINDSLSTNVLSAIAAVEAVDGPLVLLAGGFERGIDYHPLAQHLLGRRDPTLLVTLPTNGPRIRQAVDDLAGESTLEVRAAESLPAAVEAGFEWLRHGGGTVLLSPAAASFDLFTDYRHRAEVFAQAMAELPAAPSR